VSSPISKKELIFLLLIYGGEIDENERLLGMFKFEFYDYSVRRLRLSFLSINLVGLYLVSKFSTRGLKILLFTFVLYYLKSLIDLKIVISPCF
jgi:hypothetical protein